MATSRTIDPSSYRQPLFLYCGIHRFQLAWELAMSNLPFWLGIGAAQKGAGSKPIERRHWVASLIVGILGALLIAVGMFFLLVSHQQ